MKKISDHDWERIFGLKKEDKDEEEFKEFIDQMESISERELVPKEEINRELIPKKINIPKKTILSPDDEIDLHGLTRKEAEERLKVFLSNAKAEGLKIVIVVTGKGKHSKKGPSLKPFVEKWIKTEGRDFVKSFGVAPKSHGGDGAFVIFLR